MEDHTTLASTYARLEKDRKPYTDRAEDAAEVTIPYLFPPVDNVRETSPFKTPWQSLGARGVNHLASKLLLILFPPNTPFFRFLPEEAELNLLESEQPGIRSVIESGLGEVERMIMNELETTSVRVAVFNALKQLIVSGNTLFYVPTKGDIRVFRMDRYVVDRDPMGNVLQTITKEDLTIETLPEKIREAVLGQTDEPHTKDFQLYTQVKLVGNKWEVKQEVAGIPLEDSLGSFPKDDNPYVALRQTKIDGESYGPGFVEESLGDLMSLERLSQALMEGSAAAAKVTYLVHPNSTTSIKELANSVNGGFVTGSATDIDTLQLNKFNDFRVVAETIEKLRTSLSMTFLLNSGVQRSGERVTATEIQFMAQELEEALGGVYSVLTQEFQIPLVNALMRRLKSQGRLPNIPKDLIKPSIVTGLDALGRGNDQTKLERWLATVVQTLGPQALERLNISDFLLRSAVNIGVDIDGLVKSEEQIQQEQQAAQQAQQQAAMAQQAVAPMINQGGQALREQQE